MKRYVINAGRLRQKVTVQKRTEKQNRDGDVQGCWVDQETRRAAILPLSGNEVFESDQTDARLKLRVVMRAQGLTLTEDMRLKYGTRILNITSVMNIEERGRKIVAMCTEDTTNEDG